MWSCNALNSAQLFLETTDAHCEIKIKQEVFFQKPSKVFQFLTPNKWPPHPFVCISGNHISMSTSSRKALVGSPLTKASLCVMQWTSKDVGYIFSFA